uniref:THAP domain-containing protein 1 n=1 Tax=Neogobius melanostomus TaxID=47308 RepID=A0A8C6T677_9GOBI
MPFICIVPGCDNKQKVYSVVMFHRFPTHPKRRKKWFDALKMDPTNLEGLKNWRVCPEHFTEEDYTSSGLRLKNSATPTILRSHPIGATAMDMSATSVFDVSMTSETALDPADISFVPDSSTSTSTTGSSSSLSGQPRGFKERKWIVNESKLLELFLICPKCGSAMCDLNQTITQFGSRIYINWQCNNGHMGQWESCPNVRGMAENLLATAATVFTGSTYTDIN